MSMSFRTFVFFSIAVVVSGCGASKPPSCSSPDVQEVLRDIMREQVMKEYEKNGAPVICYGYYKPDTQEIVDFCKSYEKKASDAVINISSIRTQGKDDKTKKSECTASVQVERKSIMGVKTSENEVNYTAQYTDDGSEVYVQLTY